MIDTSRKVALLKKVHLFHGMAEEQLVSIAEELEDSSYTKGQTIFKQGELSEKFYIILEGKVDLRRSRGGADFRIGSLVPGDYFGSDAALARSRRYANAVVTADAVVLVFSRDQVLKLVNSSQHFKNSLRAIFNSRQLSQSLTFKWLEPDEVVYFLSRKHPILLYEALLGPFFAALLPGVLAYLYVLTLSLVPAALAGATTTIIFLWIIWIWLDWGNDYYIITNRRVVWLEKVIALYDSRQEAPLTTILPVAVETDIIGRLLDYGDLIVRTYTGRIIFRSVPQPYQVAAMVEEYRARSQEVSRRQEVEAMKKTLRTKMGLIQAQPAPSPPPAPPKSEKERINIPQILLSNIFKLRTEQGGTVTFRKHWFILVQQTWKPGLLFLLLVWLLSLNFIYNTGDSQGTFGIILLSILVIVFLWWAYELVDWRNDRFQVTPEQIVDLDKKPLGLEQRKSAKLEDILSIEYKRIGLLGIILNFGTVFIMVGNTQFTFDEVPDPATVAQEVEQRRNARIIKKRDVENAAERERIAEWLVTYSGVSKELGSLDEEFRSRSNPE